jgi:hypothetical protein
VRVRNAAIASASIPLWVAEVCVSGALNEAIPCCDSSASLISSVCEVCAKALRAPDCPKIVVAASLGGPGPHRSASTTCLVARETGSCGSALVGARPGGPDHCVRSA